MGRTIPSYLIGSEIEILKWRPFRKLLDKQDRKKFDEMLSIPQLYTSRTRSYETEAERQITQSQNFELTIRLRESAINELKTIGWNLHRSNKPIQDL